MSPIVGRPLELIWFDHELIDIIHEYLVLSGVYELITSQYI